MAAGACAEGALGGGTGAAAGGGTGGMAAGACAEGALGGGTGGAVAGGGGTGGMAGAAGGGGTGGMAGAAAVAAGTCSGTITPFPAAVPSSLTASALAPDWAASVMVTSPRWWCCPPATRR